MDAPSDHADAMVLANILRTDAHLHRVLPQDSELVQAIAVLARAHQDATWRRSRASNELRSLSREFYPVSLNAFADRKGNLTSTEARAVLAIAPTPAAAAKPSQARIAAALRRGGRQRGVDNLANQLHEALRQRQLHQPPMVENAMGTQVLALLATLNVECASRRPIGRSSQRGVPPAPRSRHRHQPARPG